MSLLSRISAKNPDTSVLLNLLNVLLQEVYVVYVIGIFLNILVFRIMNNNSKK